MKKTLFSLVAVLSLAGAALADQTPDHKVLVLKNKDGAAILGYDAVAYFTDNKPGGSVAAGWNAPNRVVLTKNAQPGEKFQIAVFGINGPNSTHPDTYIWVRSATLDFYSSNKLSKPREVKLQVDKNDVALDAIIPANAKLEKLADGFAFTEGPVWIDALNPAIGPDSNEGFLLFSDPNNNVIYRIRLNNRGALAFAKGLKRPFPA